MGFYVMINPMLQKLKPHLLLALAYTFLVLGQQYVFMFIIDLPFQVLPLWKYLFIYALLFAFTFIKGPKTRFFFLCSLIIVAFFDMGHYSYYGTPTAASEIWLGLQVHEIGGVLANESHHVWIPLVVTLIPLALAGVVNWKIKPNYQHIAVTMAAIALVIFFPARAYYAGHDWGKIPSKNDLMGFNMYGSFSFFLGRILPHKITGGFLPADPNSSMYLKFEDEEHKKSQWDKVVVVMGESLSSNHMSLFGYKLPTTPFLETLKDDPNFFYTTGISSGVNTDVSVAFFLNLTFGPPGKLKSSIGEHCLFKLAKSNKFNTHFLSIQTLEQLKYISPYLCFGHIDDFRPMEMVAPHTPDHMAARDRDLIPPFTELLEKNSQDFILLHQRGSHGPWALRSTDESRIFVAKNKKEKPVVDYDNSVVEFDLFMRDLITELKKSKKKTLVIYISDHGEGLGENGNWGHGTLVPESFETPILITSINAPLPKEVGEFPPVLTQYGLGLFITEQMGLKANQKSSEQVEDFIVYGNDIDGFAGKAEMKFLPEGKYEFKVIPY